MVVGAEFKWALSARFLQPSPKPEPQSTVLTSLWKLHTVLILIVLCLGHHWYIHLRFQTRSQRAVKMNLFVCLAVLLTAAIPEAKPVEKRQIGGVSLKVPS